MACYICWTSIVSSSSFGHQPPRTSMTIFFTLVDVIPWVLLPQLPSQNTLLDCLFLIHLSTILHPWTIHFKTKLRPKWPKKFFSFRTAPPLSQGLDDRLTPYLKVWIRYWFQLHRLSFPYDHEQCISYYRSFILPGLNGKNAWLRPWRFCHPLMQGKWYIFAP